MQEIKALWYSLVLNAAKIGITNMYMNVDPKNVENAPKISSYLKKLKKKILKNYAEKKNW